MARNASNSEWAPSSYRDFSWTQADCPSAIHVFDALLHPAIRDWPTTYTIDFLKRGLTRHWSVHNLTRPGDFELLEWFFKVANGTSDILTIRNELNGFVLDDCLDDFCKSLSYEGNSDQAGRGMFVTYFLEASLVTAYLAIIAVNKIRTQRQCETNSEQQERWGWNGISSATSNSLRPFLDAAILFALAMQIAAISVFCQPLLHPNDATSITGVVISAFTSLFSIFPAAALQFCSAHQLRRAWFRRCAWLVILILALIIFIMFVFSDYSIWTLIRTNGDSIYFAVEKDQELQLTWETICLKNDLVEQFTAAYAALFGILCIGGVLYILVAGVRLIPWLRKFVEKFPIVGKIKRIEPVFSTLVSFCSMWASLGVLTIYRTKMSFQSSVANKDDAWTFGQILSVATFVPVAIEFGMIYFGGSKNGLTGLLPRSWRAERVKESGGQVVSNTATQPTRKRDGV